MRKPVKNWIFQNDKNEYMECFCGILEDNDFLVALTYRKKERIIGKIEYSNWDEEFFPQDRTIRYWSIPCKLNLVSIYNFFKEKIEKFGDHWHLIDIETDWKMTDPEYKSEFMKNLLEEIDREIEEEEMERERELEELGGKNFPNILDYMVDDNNEETNNEFCFVGTKDGENNE